MTPVLLIDDEDVFREDLAALLREEGYECLTAPDGIEGLRLAELEQPEIIITDIVMPGLSGLDVVNRLAALCPETSVIVITAHAMIDSAVDAFRSGAADYLIKPILPEDLFEKLHRCVEHRRLQSELRYLRRELSDASDPAEIIGVSPAIEAVRQMIQRVGPSRSNILITGESGTGKELVARALHRAGREPHHPFIAVNCAALPHDIIESELFGHMRGAFTGAHRDKPGYFELANGGTLFLDEICELPLDLQPKLLRAIEHQEIFRLGGTRQIKTNVRIVAATNRELKREIAEKRFREDLYFRLSVVGIDLPPLRDRREDVPPLVEHIVRRLNLTSSRRILGVSNPAMRILMSAQWRGNVRELENVLERAALLSDGEYIGIADLPTDLTGPVHCPELSDDLRRAVRAYEREHIRQVLSAAGGSREEASRRLGIDASTLYRRMKELEIS